MRKENEQKSRWDKSADRGYATPESVAPQAFVDWWIDHDHCPQRCVSPDGVRGMSSGITAHKAWQLQCYRDEFSARKHESARGTGINYAFYNSWKPTEEQIPAIYRYAKSLADVKEVVKSLGEKMDMNKAIGWTEEDSQALEEHGEHT